MLVLLFHDLIKESRRRADDQLVASAFCDDHSFLLDLFKWIDTPRRRLTDDAFAAQVYQRRVAVGIGERVLVVAMSDAMQVDPAGTWAIRRRSSLISGSSTAPLA